MIKCKDKRTDHRAPLGVKVSWATDDCKWHEDSAHNISSTGMMLWTQQPIDNGSSVKLDFKLPNPKFKASIMVDAEVVRVVQRQGRQVGLGLKFLTLRSSNYQSVKEFIFRILGLPLESVMSELGSHDETGYTFQMEQLDREAKAERADAAERKTAQTEELQRKLVIRGWVWSGVKIGLFLFGAIIILKVAGVILGLTFRM